MCTVSWMPRPDGYELFFNRDERLSRADEEPPRLIEREGTQLIAPIDGEAQGSWLSVNEHGVAIGLLNGYRPSLARSAGARSRGQLVLEVASSSNLSRLHARLAACELASFEPFVLIGLAPAGEPIICDWDGATLRIDSKANGRMPLSSSGVHPLEAQRRRRALLEVLARSHGRLDRGLLLDFHASHEEEASAYSPCMHRADAETRSLCHVVVGGASVSMAHAPGAPCRTAVGAPLVLARA